MILWGLGIGDWGLDDDDEDEYKEGDNDDGLSDL